MLREYFNIYLDDDGNLRGMPRLLDDHVPEPSALPAFLWRLAHQTEWRYEKPCFESIARNLGVAYATLPNDRDDDDELSKDAELILKQKLLPALKALLLAPVHLDDEECMARITSLERLFRVFERC